MQKAAIGIMFLGFMLAIFLDYSFAGIIAWLGTLVGVGLLLVHSKLQKQMKHFAFFLVCFILSLSGVFYI
ncbi:hypothetical protein [Rossellomorea aquimaris]|uniref:Uncharacterized protein n=1 Tax=Rossellomorea aquimaris TaxID=189382 RepID=A0A5D4T8F9_9BACI|nr:hypothetical protein [Rossellomorea aquimaris]TYS72017.1 hypothetical protein FZC80_21335 [Rossellomorea aquimaris]